MSNTAPASPEKKYEGPVISYELKDGKITRTDKDSTVVVAHYDGKTVSIVPEWAKFRTAVIRWLNDNEHAYEAVIRLGDSPDKVTENIPPCPKKDMRFGDKTPAVVEWYRRYKPAEYRARYGIKGEGTVTKFRKEIDEKGQPRSVPYEVQATLAERKIHTTEKLEAGNSDVGEYNDQ